MSAENLLAIYKEAAALLAQDRAADPVACPKCGEPLERTPRGLHCRFVCGWKPDC